MYVTKIFAINGPLICFMWKRRWVSDTWWALDTWKVVEMYFTDQKVWVTLYACKHNCQKLECLAGVVRCCTCRDLPAHPCWVVIHSTIVTLPYYAQVTCYYCPTHYITLAILVLTKNYSQSVGGHLILPTIPFLLTQPGHFKLARCQENFYTNTVVIIKWSW